MGLNEQCKDAAYVLGREFAVLEAIQEDANPGINVTIRDRYFNSACATPASIFPILQKLKNSHIRKLETGKRVYYEKILTELQGKIEVETVYCISTSIIIGRTGDVHFRILPPGSETLREKGGKVNERGN